MSKNIYDIPLNTWDEKPNMLDDYRGKVTLFINVTTDCGNAPEYRIIEDIYQKYKDSGFEVVAIPTNEYCGPGIVYDEFVNGINCALDAKNYAETKHGVTYNFSEIVNSQPGEKVSTELLDHLYPQRQDSFPRPLNEGEQPHPIFQALCNFNGSDMFGNFEKYLVNSNGDVVARYHNGCLMPRTEEIEYGSKFNLDAEKIEYDKDGLCQIPPAHNHGEHFYNMICDHIESLL